MSYFYRINMSNFWKLDSSIVKVINPNDDRTEIVIQTSETIPDPLQTFLNEEEVISFTNISGSGFWYMEPEGTFWEEYVPEADDPILLNTGSAE